MRTSSPYVKPKPKDTQSTHVFVPFLGNLCSKKGTRNSAHLACGPRTANLKWMQNPLLLWGEVKWLRNPLPLFASQGGRYLVCWPGFKVGADPPLPPQCGPSGASNPHVQPRADRRPPCTPDLVESAHPKPSAVSE